MSRRVYLFPDLKLAGVPWTRQYVYRLEAKGQFPQRFKLGDRQVAWVADEVDAWLAERMASRKQAA